MKKLQKNITHIILLLVVLLMMVGCQPTPEQIIVVPKTEKSFNQMLFDAGADINLENGEMKCLYQFDNEPVSPKNPYIAPDNLLYDLSLKNTFVSVDANITIPQYAMPIYIMEPGRLSYEQVNEFLDIICDDDEELYENSFFKQAITVKQIELLIKSKMEEIDMLKNTPDSEFPTVSKDILIAGLNTQITDLYKFIQNAPTDYNDARERLDYSGKDNFGQSFIIDNTYPVKITENNYLDRNYRLSIGYSSSLGCMVNIATEHYKRQQLVYMEDDHDVAIPKVSSVEDAISICDNLMDMINGISKDNYIEEKQTGNAIWGIEYMFGRQLNGVNFNLFKPMPYIWRYSSYDTGTSMAYDEKFALETMRIGFNKYGNLTRLSYKSPMLQTKLITSDAKLLPFERIQEIFDRYIVLNGFTADETTRLNITDIKLGLQRIKIPNTDQYLSMPVWDFYGNFIIEDFFNEDLETYDYVDRSDLKHCTFLTINAINGAIIDVGNGY